MLDEHLRHLEIIRWIRYHAKARGFPTASIEREIESHIKFLNEEYGYEEHPLPELSDDALLALLEA